MSKSVDKLISKLFAVLIIVIFIAVFKDLIINDSGVSAAFGALMGVLPFAKQISDVICKLMKYQTSIPPFTPEKFIFDFLKLAIMASIQPLAVRWLSRLFLKVPKGSIEEQEEYMEGASFRIKELIIAVLTAPLIAFVAARITTSAMDYLNSNAGALVTSIIGVIATLAITFISVAPLVILGGLTMGKALLWRVSITLVGKMLTTTGISALCIWLYLAITGGYHAQIFASIISLVVFMLIMEFALNCIKRTIAGRS